MSLIAYKDGILSVDNAGLSMQVDGRETEMPSPCKLNKGFVSGDKRIAVVYTGDEIDFKSDLWKKQVAIFKRALSFIGGGAPSISKKVAILEDLRNRCYYVLTSNVCYRAESGKEDHVNLIPISESEWEFHGMGRDVASFCVTSGIAKTREDIFSLVGRNTYGMWDAGFVSFDRKDLKPFAKRKNNREEKKESEK